MPVNKVVTEARVHGASLAASSYRMPSRASLVVYLLPVTALIYGAVLLGETVTMSAIAGLVLILTGTALGSGLIRLPRRAPVPASP